MGICGDQTFLASEEVTRRYGKWRPPDQDKAATHYRTEHAHHDFFDVYSSKVREFKEFGVGHMMYFYFLQWMAALFAVLAVLTGIPNMALNYFGRYYDTGALEMTTLGNFGAVSWTHHNDGPAQMAMLTPATGWEREVFISSLFMNTTQQPPATQPFNKRSAIIAMSALDFVGVVVYFSVTFVLAWIARKLVRDADVNTVTIHDYSIRVERLPRNATTDELVEFFSQYGEVVHVEMIRAYGRLLGMVLQRGKLLRQLQTATANLQKEAMDWHEVPASKEVACYKIKDQIDQLSRDIQIEQSMADSHRVVGAFVTFKDETGKLECLKAQPRSRLRAWWTLKPEHKLRNRHALGISDAPEPSDVQYENIEHGTLERLLRSFLVACCSYTCLAVGFALISMASAMRLNLGKAAGVQTNDCDTNCRMSVNGALGLSSADRDLYLACGTSGQMANGTECAAADKICYKCYCAQAMTSGLLGESVYCSKLVNVLVLQYTSQVMVVLAILIINTVLSMTSRMLTLFEKHHTRSTEAKSLAHKLFLAQFMNSALSTIIANAHIPFLADAMEGTAFDGLFFQGIFTDLTPNWYKLIGRSLVVSQFVGAALRIFRLVTKWAMSKYAYRHRQKCLTQHELQTSLAGPEFELDLRYGEHLNAIYVAMLLSGGLPVAYISAAFWFCTSYWCDKYELLTLSRRPITYGADLSNMVVDRLPFAAMLHLIFSMWAFSIYGVPRSGLSTPAFASLMRKICTGLAAMFEHACGITVDQATERLLGANSLHLLVLLIILVGVLFFNIIRSNLWLALRWVLTMTGVTVDKEQEPEVSGAPEFPVAVRTQLLVGESSYAIQAQPMYASAFTRVEDAVGDVLVQVVMKKGASILAAGGAADIKAPIKQASPRSPSGLDPTSPPASKKQVMQQPAAAPTARRTGTPKAAWQQEQLKQQQQEQQKRREPRPVSGNPPQQISEQAQEATNVSTFRGRISESEAAAATAAAEEDAADEGLESQQPQRRDSRASNASRDSGRPTGTPDRLSLPQRYRQARANQVVPIPEEYIGSIHGSQ